jgi:hypothetical protein
MYLCLRRAGYGLHREPLASVVLDAAENNKGDGETFPGDGVEDVLFPKGIFTGPRRHFEHSFRGIESMGEGL